MRVENILFVEVVEMNLASLAPTKLRCMNNRPLARRGSSALRLNVNTPDRRLFGRLRRSDKRCSQASSFDFKRFAVAQT